MSVRPSKTQISLGLRPVWSELSLGAQWVAKDPSVFHADSEDYSDWADAQADLSLRWAHTHFVCFVMSRLIFTFIFQGGTQLVMGVASTVCYVSEIVMFYLVFKILKKTGCLVFMVIGFTGYSIRFLVFGLMENPWIVLPFEVLQGILGLFFLSFPDKSK